MTRLTAALLLAALGCTSPSTTGGDGYALVLGHPWPGATATVSGPGLADVASSAVLLLDEVTLPLERSGATTMQAVVPEEVHGFPVATLRIDDEEHALGTVRIAGFVGSRRYTAGAAAFTSEAYPVPWLGEPVVVGGVGFGLGTVNLATGAVGYLAGVLREETQRGPGVTSQPGVLVLNGGEGYRRWTIGPAGPALVAEHPELQGPSRDLVRLGPDAWLRGTETEIQVIERVFGSGTWVTNGIPSTPTAGNYLSPSGLHGMLGAVIRDGAGEWEGVPVFDAPSGHLAYTIPIKTVPRVGFSATGDRIILASFPASEPLNATAGGPRLSVVDAASGFIILDTVLGGWAFDVVHDPVHDWLLVGIGLSTGGVFRPALAVLDPATLAPIAVLTSPAEAPSCPTTCARGVLAPSSTGRVHVYHPAARHGVGNDPASWEFLLPD